jgi:hypothetical protein
VAAVLAATGIAFTPLVAAPLRAQEPDPIEAVRDRVAPEVAQALTELLAVARRLGVPTEPLMDKALEGTAKRVPGAQIVEALRALLNDLGQAQTLMRGTAAVHARDVVAVAVALRRGAPPEAVRRLALGATPSEPFGVTVHTLADLIQRGVSDADAVEMLLTWRARGADPEALSQIPGVVDRLIRQGVLPAQAASAVSGAMRAGRPPASAGPPGGAGPPRPPGRPPGGP